MYILLKSIPIFSVSFQSQNVSYVKVVLVYFSLKILNRTWFHFLQWKNKNIFEVSRSSTWLCWHCFNISLRILHPSSSWTLLILGICLTLRRNSGFLIKQILPLFLCLNNWDIFDRMQYSGNSKQISKKSWI